MWRLAKAPNPVETPYTGIPPAAYSSMYLREPFIAVTLSGEIETFAPKRATAITSAKVNPDVPRTTSVI